jgi:hypothetical protein
MQLRLREIADNGTREDVPGQPYLPVGVQNSLRSGISEGWAELHLTIVEEILGHADIAKVDTDKQLRESPEWSKHDAEREWAEVTNGKYLEESWSFDGSGNKVRRLVSPDYAAGPVLFKLVETTDLAKMKALKLKAGAAADGLALANSFGTAGERMPPAAPTGAVGNGNAPRLTRLELDAKLDRHVAHAKATGTGFRFKAAFHRHLKIDKAEYSRWLNHKPMHAPSYAERIEDAIMKLPAPD